MSITLSIPPAVVQEARAYAAENGTTMSRMVREYFTGLVSPKPERRVASQVGSPFHRRPRTAMERRPYLI